MLNIINSSTFNRLYVESKDHSYIDGVIYACDRLAFDKWMKANVTTSELSIRELRIKAAAKQVLRYSRMDKATLIREIQDAKD